MSEITKHQIQPLAHHMPDMAQQINELLHAAYRVEAALLEVSDFAPLRRTAAEVQYSDNAFWGVQQQGRLVGVVELESTGTTTLIASLGILPELHRQGIGAALVSFVQTRAGCPVRVTTATDNLPAVCLYTRCGFQPIGRQDTPQGIELMHFQWHPRVNPAPQR